MESIKYLDFLESNKVSILEQLELLMKRYKVQPVGNGFIDCIVLKENLEEFIKNASNLGILISGTDWWCYVDPYDINAGCPHGMGGPRSIYYEGWFSELQTDFYESDKKIIDELLVSYDQEILSSLNMKFLADIKEVLGKSFPFKPNEYIKENKCVNPGLWLLVPDSWNCIKHLKNS